MFTCPTLKYFKFARFPCSLVKQVILNITEGVLLKLTRRWPTTFLCRPENGITSVIRTSSHRNHDLLRSSSKKNKYGSFQLLHVLTSHKSAWVFHSRNNHKESQRGRRQTDSVPICPCEASTLRGRDSSRLRWWTNGMLCQEKQRDGSENRSCGRRGLRGVLCMRTRITYLVAGGSSRGSLLAGWELEGLCVCSHRGFYQVLIARADLSCCFFSLHAVMLKSRLAFIFKVLYQDRVTNRSTLLY